MHDVLRQCSLSITLLQRCLTELERSVSDVRRELRKGQEVLGDQDTGQTHTWWSLLSGEFRKKKLIQRQLDNLRRADVHSLILARDLSHSKDEISRILREVEALESYNEQLSHEAAVLPLDIKIESLSTKLLEMFGALNRLDASVEGAR